MDNMGQGNIAGQFSEVWVDHCRMRDEMHAEEEPDRKRRKRERREREAEEAREEARKAKEEEKKASEEGGKKSEGKEDADKGTVATVEKGEVAKKEKGEGQLVDITMTEEEGRVEGHDAYWQIDERSGKKLAYFTAPEVKVKLHIKEIFDYQGRSFLHQTMRPTGTPSAPPKKLGHTFSGHTDNISTLDWMPPDGHLLLSGSYDKKIKLWRVDNSGENQRGVVQTYLGHMKAISCTSPNLDGSAFLSGSFDRFIRIWNTETGQVTNTFTSGAHPQCATFYPLDNNIILVGMGDKKIMQWDVRQEKPTQEYNQHLGPVNTITYFGEGTKFLTTSDDKTIRIWEHDVPTALKYFQERDMTNMPCAALHPTHQYVAYQSTNEVVTYRVGMEATSHRVSKQNKKSFKGLNTAGYACQPSFSPDGDYLCCGDGEGYLWFWEWKTTRWIKKLKAHEKCCKSALWHPVMPNWVVTGGWDKKIRLWV